ncbi:uncharacterized protein N7529_010884 [Penicillium soppii]|uniref:uncharacterized protein n=1 Tax=Penicillium soppii TaxID=69789 RepID=UPI0025472B74|nr:uncharacterized protein N7529_010884 [Penicillium soppii]KAJ5851499.1 hypothetical protein N7529_010884 [Penicillium soppii]
MAGSSSPAGKPEKTMSSNLLTMKFMRRAAAAKESSPAESVPHTPKRARLSTEAESPRTSDMDAITAALAAEEQKRQEAVSRAAEEAGETHWVLNFPDAPQYNPQPLVLAADSLDADDNAYSGGRQAFGNFKRKERQPQAGLSKEENDHRNEDDDEIVNQHKFDPQGDKFQNFRAREEKRKQPKLSQLTSISGSGGRGGPMMGGPSSDKKKKRKSR